MRRLLCCVYQQFLRLLDDRSQAGGLAQRSFTIADLRNAEL